MRALARGPAPGRGARGVPRAPGGRWPTSWGWTRPPAVRELEARILRGDSGRRPRRGPRRGAGPAGVRRAAAVAPRRDGRARGGLDAAARVPRPAAAGDPGRTRGRRQDPARPRGRPRAGRRGASRVWWADLSTASPERLVDALAEATGTEIPRGPDPAGLLARRPVRPPRRAVPGQRRDGARRARAAGRAAARGRAGLVLLATSRERLARRRRSTSTSWRRCPCPPARTGTTPRSGCSSTGRRAWRRPR